MSVRKTVEAGVVALVLTILLGALPSCEAGEPCSSCADCSEKLNSGLYSTVTLTADIVDHAGDCIVLNDWAEDVIFDCDRHKIDGDGFDINPERGISLMHSTRVTVLNCSISDFDAGIFMVDSIDCVLTNNLVSENSMGIEMAHSHSNLLSENLVSGNVTGIKLSDSDSNHLFSNDFCENQIWDIYFAQGNDNVGDENKCDVSFEWAENEVPGCTYSCLVFSDGFESGDCDEWVE